MSELSGKPGIEIQVGLSGGQMTVGKLLHALHLDRLGELVARNATAVIVLDGKETREPMYEAHFVEAEPGEHDLKMYFTQGPVPAPDSVQETFFGNTIKVTVEKGMVTVVRYTPHEVYGAELEVIGARTA